MGDVQAQVSQIRCVDTECCHRIVCKCLNTDPGEGEGREPGDNSSIYYWPSLSPNSTLDLTIQLDEAPAYVRVFAIGLPEAVLGLLWLALRRRSTVAWVYN